MFIVSLFCEVYDFIIAYENVKQHINYAQISVPKYGDVNGCLPTSATTDDRQVVPALTTIGIGHLVGNVFKTRLDIVGGFLFQIGAIRNFWTCFLEDPLFDVAIEGF